jgi:hypothetical protein
MIRFGSIRQRLIAMHFIAVLAAALVLPMVLYWRVDTTAQSLHERALREQAGQILRYLHQRTDGGWTLDLPDRVRQLYSAGYERYGFAILRRDGQVLFPTLGTMSRYSRQTAAKTILFTWSGMPESHVCLAPASRRSSMVSISGSKSPRIRPTAMC